MKYAIGLLLAALAAAGCTENTRNSSVDSQSRGRVYLLSGAGGMMGECERVRDGLKQAGVCRPIEIYRWSHGGVLEDQTSLAANRRKARDLAARVESFLRRNPGAEVHLIGVSAGTGLVVWALEDLDPAYPATAGILISSSLDTAYDLTRAFRNTRDGIYSFTSMADTVLSLGVTWAGTVDRNGGLAAGLVGFSIPANASDETRRLYHEKLHEIGWWPGDAVLGHIGDHLGATSPGYVKEKVAPIVLGQEPPKPPESADQPATPDKAKPADHPDADDTPEPPAKPKKRTGMEAVSSPAKEQGDEAAHDLDGPDDGESRTNRGDRGRFHNWQVHTPDAPASTVRGLDESVFFSRPERLP